MSEKKIVGYDYTMPYADGSDDVTTSLRKLLNSYPGLKNNDEITFAVLECYGFLCRFCILLFIIY